MVDHLALTLLASEGSHGLRNKGISIIEILKLNESPDTKQILPSCWERS